MIPRTPVRWSTLREMGRSPLHYAYRAAHPMDATPAMRLGTLVHQLALDQPVTAVVYEGERRGKAWSSFRDEHGTVEIVTEREMHEAEMVAAAIAADPLAAAALRGVRERRLEWRIGDRACAGTPDVVGPTHIAELKTTADASPDKFPWHARRMGYLAQLAWYLSGVATDPSRAPITSLVIVAAETKPPYAVATYELSVAAILAGERQWRACWERLMVCEAADAWPSYSQSRIELDVPGEDLDLDFGAEEAA
jgi:hypothetical protein